MAEVTFQYIYLMKIMNLENFGPDELNSFLL